MAGQMQTINRMVAEAERYVPVVQVSFHTEDKLYQIRGVSKGSEGEYDPTDLLTSVTTNKSLDAPAGTFSVNLLGDQWFLKNGNPVLKPNDLVIIHMGYKAKKDTIKWVDGTSHTSEEDLDTVMIGLVDNVSRTRNGGGNGVAPTMTTTVTGRDFGKLLIKAMLRFYPELGWDKSKEQKFFLTQEGWITLLKAFTNDNTIKGSPAKILDVIMRFILKQVMDINWKVYDDNSYQGQGGVRTVNISNILRYRFAQTNFFIPFFMSAQQYEGSIWNMMDRVNMKPFTEMFLDTRDRWEVSNGSGIPQLVNETCEEDSGSAKGNLAEDKGKWNYPATMFGSKDGAQAVLVFRNTPFDRDSWSKLRSHTIPEVDIVSENLSYSDNENYNVFWAGSTLTPFADLDLKRVQPPLMNEANVKRYGLNPLEVQVEGLQLDASQGIDQQINLELLTSNLNAKLKAWFQDNVTYLSGSMDMRGKADLKIGQRLIHQKLGREFYVESVTQSFQVYGDWHTSVSVTRGMNPPIPNSGDYVKGGTIKKPVPPPVAPAPVVTARYYTVVKGDTLWAIATRYYGSGVKWTKIWEANKTMLIARDKRNASDPGHWIYPGSKLIIP